MPRDSNGTYTLPSGNPVVTGTVIAAGWANPTMGDIGNELTNSLDRQGRGGMLAPFKFVDGLVGAPGITWTNEPTTGFWRAGAGDQQAVVAGIPRMRWTSVGVDVWDSPNSTWLPLSTAAGSNFALLNAQNKFTQSQVIVNTSPVLQLWKDNTPSVGARFAFNTAITDGLDIGYFNGTSWNLKFGATDTNSQYANDSHQFINKALNATFASLNNTGFTLRDGRQLGLNNADNSFGASISNTGTPGQTNLSFFVGGAQIAMATTASFSLLGNGADFRVYAPDVATVCVLKVDSAGAAYWNQNGTGYQWYHNGSVKATLSPTDLTLAAGVDLRLNTETAIRQNPSGPMLGAQMRDVEGWKGPALYFAADSANYRSGNVFVSTTEAPASGYTAGTIWMQREA